MSKETYVYGKETYKRDLPKRLRAESYKTDLCQSKESYRRDLQERPTKKTDKKDLQKKPESANESIAVASATTAAGS